MSECIDSLIASMTLNQKIGQILMYGWQGETEEENITVSSHARVLLEEFEVGGVCLLGRNVGSPERTARTMNELQERSDIPLFIIADQEGGMVARFKDPFVVFPSNMTLGASGNPELAYRAARAIAGQLRAVGVNFDFAPVVDVNNNPGNPIIGTRSYGDSADAVSRFASEAIRGFHEGGVMTSAKHFPGHGDTAVDSHLALPVVDFPRDRLEQVELPPFRAAIKAGVAAVMTTHILFPHLDPDLPSTLSRPILTGLLREDMGFDGLVVTDDLEMKGVADEWGTAEAAVMSFKAGADCPLICHTLELQRKAHALLHSAVESGEIPLERLEQSVRRVLALKERFGLLDGYGAADPLAAESVVSSPDKHALALEIANRGITIARNEDGVLPARLKPSERIAVVSLHPRLPDIANALRKLHPNVDAIVPSSPGVRIPDGTGLIVAATCRSEPWTEGMDEDLQQAFVKNLIKSGRPLAVVALRDPYDIRWFPEVRTYVCMYGYVKTTIEALAELLLGRSEAQGSLPVKIEA